MGYKVGDMVVYPRHGAATKSCDYMISVRREAAAGLGVNR